MMGRVAYLRQAPLIAGLIASATIVAVLADGVVGSIAGR
jgi:hypothetical protein